MNDVSAFINYWNDKYTGSAPQFSDWLSSVTDSMPRRMTTSVQKLGETPLFPEPYFGYLNADTSNDILLLLLNPGEVREDLSAMNAQTVERFRTWTKDEYLSERDKIPSEAYKWRQARLKEACRIIDGGESSIHRFLHTVEYFPFHSKKFDFLNSESRAWISEWEATRFMVNAVRNIARESKVQFIFAIGILWTNLLKDYGFEQQEYVTLGPKLNSHRIWRFQLPGEPSSQPIIVYVSGAGRIGLPSSAEAISAIRQLMR